jgi:hypothetical protein
MSFSIKDLRLSAATDEVYHFLSLVDQVIHEQLDIYKNMGGLRITWKINTFPKQ